VGKKKQKLHNRDLRPKLWNEIEEKLNVAGKY
jgi:hypothetical protein